MIIVASPKHGPLVALRGSLMVWMSLVASALVGPGCGGGTSPLATGGDTGVGGGAATPGMAGTPGSRGDAAGSSGNGSGGVTGGQSGTGGTATGGASANGGSTAGGSGVGGRAASGGTGTSGTASAGSAGSSGAGGLPAAGCLDFKTPTMVGTIANAALTGPSGMVASRAHPGVLYAHLDMGGTATIYAMTVTGKDLGSFALVGATATDWEDISVGKGPAAGSYIYVGDFGDNSVNRTQIQVYRVPEPETSTTQPASQQMLTNWQVMRFTYPDGAHNAETLMVDPISGDILILTKDSNGNSTLFRAPSAASTDTPSVLEKVTMVQIGASGQAAQASAGDIAPTGDRIIVRTYATILLWPRAATWPATFMATPKMLPAPTEPQSEGISFSADGKSWISTGEQARAIYQADANCP